MGSLFQLREYWYASFASEEYGVGSLVCGAFVCDHDARNGGRVRDDDDDSNNKQKKKADDNNTEGCDEVDVVIALGSYAGCLRIVAPGKARGAMAPHELLCEKKLGEPILQLCCGAFVPVYSSSSNGNHADRVTADTTRRGRSLLAVLLPRRLLFLRVQRTGSRGNRNDKDDDDKNDDEDNNNKAHMADDMGDAMQAVDELASIGDACECVVYREVRFARSLCNMVAGPFAGAAHDMLCVQSMDGHLALLDHTGVLYECVLPANQFMLPGCLAYCAATDCILTGNSALLVVCYRVTDLASAAAAHDAVADTASEHGARATGMGVDDTRHARDTKDEDDVDGKGDGRGATAAAAAADASAARTLRPWWAYSVGEDVLALTVCRLTRGLRAGDADVVVLCPYALHILSVDGACRLMRLFEVEALTMCAYAMPGMSQHNLLITTHDKTLLVYDDVTLCWTAALPTSGCAASEDVTTTTRSTTTAAAAAAAAVDDEEEQQQCADAAVCVAVANVCSMRGLVLTLTARGALAACYLGTDPADKTLQPLEAQAQSYHDMCATLYDVDGVIAQQEQYGHAAAAAAAVVLHEEQQQQQPSSHCVHEVVTTAATSAAAHTTTDVAAVAAAAAGGDAAMTASSSSPSAVAAATAATTRTAVESSCITLRFADVCTSTADDDKNDGDAHDGAIAQTTPRPLAGYAAARLSLIVSLREQSSQQALHDVVVHMHTTPPLVVTPSRVRVPALRPAHDVTLHLRVVAVPQPSGEGDERTRVVTPSSLTVTAVAVASPCDAHHNAADEDSNNNKGDALAHAAPHVTLLTTTAATRRLPLALVARLVPVTPLQSVCGVQINTNKTPPPSLLDLFSDMATTTAMRDEGNGNTQTMATTTTTTLLSANALTLRLVDGSEATLLVSRNAARFRVQSATLPALWLLSDELVRRVRCFYDGDKNNNNDNDNDSSSNSSDHDGSARAASPSSLQLSIPDEVPLDDVAAAVHTHESARAALQQAHAQLAETCAFLRVLQGRLLARLRDRAMSTTTAVGQGGAAAAAATTTSTAGMDALLTECYGVLQHRLDAVQTAECELRSSAAALRCCAHLLYLWLSTQYTAQQQLQQQGHNEAEQVLYSIFVRDVARLDDDDDDAVAAVLCGEGGSDGGDGSGGGDVFDASASSATTRSATWAQRTEATLTRRLRLRPALVTVTASAATSTASRLRYCIEQLTERLKRGEAV